ncbi:MAG: hypothetical protein ACOY0T_38055 [Myxococcota bacterium]
MANKLMMTTVALVLLSASALAEAQAARTWSTNGITGVHAQGSTWTSNSWINIKGYVKDTKCDGGAARVYFAFISSTLPGSTEREERVSTEGKPCGTVVPFHFRGYSGKYTEVLARECVSGLGLGRGCSMAISIWKAP